MDDSFSFGHPQKHRSRTRPRRTKRAEPEPPPKHAAPRRTMANDRRRLAFGVVGVSLAVVVVWGYLHLDGAEPAGGRGSTGQIDAGDLQAKQAAAVAVQTVRSLYDQHGSFDTVTSRALRSADSSTDYVATESTDAGTVSVASTSMGVGLAVRSPSGTCFYVHVIATGVTYGTGSTCTGHAAQGASAPAWPSQST